MKGLIGRKIGMTQVFNEEGRAVPVTVIMAGPCYVTEIRSVEKDGYSAVQLGFEEVNANRLTGGQKGHLKRFDLPALRFLREFRVKKPDVQPGDKVTVESFTLGDHVDVVATSKGKGFAGAMKRHHFSGASITHGQSDRQRAVGSIAAGTTPGHVFKGKRAPGHMGNRRVTVQNLKVVLLDSERNLLGVFGSVPGAKGSLVVVKEARKQ